MRASCTSPAGRVTITSPDKVFFPARGDTKLDLVQFYISHRRRGDAADARPPGAAAALPQRRRRARRSSRSGSPTAPPSGCTPRSSARRTAPSHERLVIADLAHLLWAVNIGCLGFHSWPIRAARPRASATSCASTSTPARAPTSRWRRRRRQPRKPLFDELGIRSYIKTTGNRGLHVYVRLQPQLRQHRGASGGRGDRPRARTAPARPDHRLVVEGGARRADLHRLQPERSRTRRCSRRGRCEPATMRRCRAGSRGSSCPTLRPTRHDDRHGAGVGWPSRATRGPT